MSDSGALYTEGYKAGYGVGFGDGKGVGYTDAQLRAHIAVEALAAHIGKAEHEKVPAAVYDAIGRPL